MEHPLIHLTCGIPVFPGGKIRELLENNGMQFPVVELQVQKFSTMSKETKKEGKWVTILDDRGTLYKDSNSD